MSAHELPQDLRLWPENPYELLGIQPGVAPRDLRRAYTHLIRTFKPEQFPEHFRRIRAAYETVMRYVEFFGTASFSPQPEAAPEPASEPAETEDASSLPEREPESLPPPKEEIVLSERGSESLPPPKENPLAAEREYEALPRPVVRDLWQTLHDLWEQACSGHEDTAYQGLLDLRDQHPAEEGIYLRLYWLLELSPELDLLRTPCDWLAAGVRATGPAGPLRELYRREIEECPSEALTERFFELFCSEPKSSTILEFLEWRWQAADRLENWHVLCQDIEALRERIVPESDELWLRVLLLAVDFLIWAPDDSSSFRRDTYIKEIEESEHIQLKLASDLDRLDLLLAVAAEWRVLGKKLRDNKVFRLLHMEVSEIWHGRISAEDSFGYLLSQSVPLFWNRRFAEVRIVFLPFLEKAAQEPPRFLAIFDQIQYHYPKLFALFGRTLHMLQGYEQEHIADSRTQDQLASLICDHLESSLGRSRRPAYPVYRKQLLNFCLREVVPPELVAETIGNHPGYQQLTQEEHYLKLSNDFPLHYLCLAHRVFWA